MFNKNFLKEIKERKTYRDTGTTETDVLISEHLEIRHNWDTCAFGFSIDLHFKLIYFEFMHWSITIY